jgi:hypothetical protein
MIARGLAYRGQVKLFSVANVSYHDQSFNSVRIIQGLLAFDIAVKSHRAH